MITVNGEQYPWREGLTVAGLLEMLEEDYEYPVVRFGEQLVSRPNYETTLIPDDVEVFLVPLVAGG